MARFPRLDLPNVPQYPVQPGSHRQPTFFMEKEYSIYLEFNTNQALVQAALGVSGGLGGYLAGSSQAALIASAGKMSVQEAAGLLNPTLTGALTSAVLPMTLNVALPASLGGMQR